MSILWVSWSFDTVIIILLLSLAVSVVSFISRVIFRIKIPMDLAAVLLIAIYIMITWACFYQFHISLTQVLPWMAWLLAVGLLVQLGVMVVQRGSGFAPEEWHRWFKGAISFFLFTVFLIALYSWFIADNRMPIAVEINNDIWVYSKYAHIALSQPLGNNVVGLDYFQNDLVEQTPSAFLFLAGLSFVLGMPIIDILTLGLILLMAYSAHIIKTICCDHFHQKKSIAWLMGLIWLTTPIISNLEFNYFLAQCLGITIFLAILSATLQSDRSLSMQLSMLTLLYYLLLMSYPGFYVPYVVLLLFAQIIVALYWQRTFDESFWSPGVISAAFAIPISAFIGVVQNPIHFQKMAAAFRRLANEPYFLSEHILINPMSFLSLPAIPSDLFHPLIGLSLLGLALYLSLTYRFSRGRRLILLSGLSYLFFMTYEHYFCVFIGLLLIIKMVDLLVYKRKKQIEYFNPYTLDVLLMVPILLTMIYLLEPTQFMGVVYRLITQNIIMAKDYSFDAGSVSANFIGNLFLIVLVCFYIQKMRKNGSLTHAKLILSCLFVFNLLFYLCYYEWKGFSYQQWKLGASLVQPLSFIPIIAIFYLLQEKKWFNTRMQLLCFIGVFLINLLLINYVMSFWVKEFSPYIPLRAVMSLDSDPTVNRVIVDIEESKNLLPKKVRGMSMAIQFVNNKPLEVPFLLYKIIDDNKVLTNGTVLITNHCTIRGTRIQLGDSFCMVRGSNAETSVKH